MTDSVQTHISNGGRVVIPIALREQFGLKDGMEVVVTSDALGIRVLTPDIAMTRLQTIARTRLKKRKSRSVVDEFIKEKRQEARKE